MTQTGQWPDSPAAERIRRLDRFALGEMITAGICRAQAQARDELTAALRGDGTREDR